MKAIRRFLVLVAISLLVALFGSNLVSKVVLRINARHSAGMSPTRPTPDEATQSNPGPRYGHQTILLGNGKLLIGGGTRNQYQAVIMIFDPERNEYKTITSKICGGYAMRATVLEDETILLTNGQCFKEENVAYTERFDPVTETVRFGGFLQLARNSPYVVKLSDDRALVYGGFVVEKTRYSYEYVYLDSFEFYHPDSNEFSLLEKEQLSLPHCKGYRTMTALTQQKDTVFLTCATENDALVMHLINVSRFTTSESRSIYFGETYHTVTELLDGNLLIANGNGVSLIYNPAKQSWTTTGSMVLERGDGFVATRLTSGRVLITGGYVKGNAFLNSVELFDPSTDLFSVLAPLSQERASHTANLLTTANASNAILVIGGRVHSWNDGRRDSEIYAVDEDITSGMESRYIMQSVSRDAYVPFIFQDHPLLSVDAKKQICSNLADFQRKFYPASRLTYCQVVQINWDAIFNEDKLRVRLKEGERVFMLTKTVKNEKNINGISLTRFAFLGCTWCNDGTSYTIFAHEDREKDFIAVSREYSVEYLDHQWKIEHCPSQITNDSMSCAVWYQMQNLDNTPLED